MTSPTHYSALHTNGFSLVELMVGMVIALISSLAIMQVFSSFENQKRSTTAGSEAQENGLMALVQMEQTIHNAGLGLTDPSQLNCTTISTYLDSAAGPIPDFSLAPLSITDGGSSGSDRITVRSGSNILAGIPTAITAPMPAASAEYNVNNPSIFSIGDLSMIMNGGQCAIQNVTHVQVASKKIQHNPGNSGPNNPSAGWGIVYPTGSQIMSLGVITAREYSIQNNNLRMIATNVASTVASPAEILVKDIVNLQAQYGVAPAGSQIVDEWVNASGPTWASPSAANQRRIKAIRLIVVARSGKKESTNVTSACTTPGGIVNVGPCAWQDTTDDPAPLIDLSADSDWRKYRYKVYQTVIPLKNVIWANV